MQANLLPPVSPKALDVKSEWFFFSPFPGLRCGRTSSIFFPLDDHPPVAFYLLDVLRPWRPGPPCCRFTLSMVLSLDSIQGTPLKRFQTPRREGYDNRFSPVEVVADLNQRFQTKDDRYFTII